MGLKVFSDLGFSLLSNHSRLYYSKNYLSWQGVQGRV
jgi:hypothetical protein